MSELPKHADLAPEAAAGFRFAVVVSRFNRRITKALLEGAQTTLATHGALDSDIFVCEVPGAFELPVAASRLADGRFDAIICLGVVIKGETPHFDYLSFSVAHGIQEVAIRSGIPAIFGVLTCEHREHAEARAGGSKGNKGAEAAIAAIEMANLFSLNLAESHFDGHTSSSS
ncbi:MAG TPA: 6,7-dimethyl-8-ribityllumazine synthase [Acidobacteria bacterium]|jgi:6,7-dimethyl-8-ribityllumazine synthase|nr:6,7-dimethyl-8-ribityllumazine synthase [Acidobacteriota bacterium]